MTKPDNQVGKRFDLVLSCCACFGAIQSGAMVVCIGTMIDEPGPFNLLEAIAVWVVSQPLTFLVAFGSMPVLVVLRFLLGRLFENPYPVAVFCGATLGLVGTLVFNWPPSAKLVLVGLIAGIIGGLTWWLMELPFIGISKKQNTG